MRRLWPLAILLLAIPALAGNGISRITVSTTRNLTSVSLTAIVNGDDDSSAVLRVFQRIYGGGRQDYDTGMVMVRRLGTTIYEGRILRMAAGQPVQYYIEAVDATSGTQRTPSDTISCAQVRPIVATGPVYYVNQSTGNDAANDGLTPATAEKTIGAAITDLTNSTNGGANGGIIVAPGEYHERIDLNFGTDGPPRFLMGDGTNPDSTILCGAKDDVENGFTGNGSTTLTWSAVGTDSVYQALCTSCDSTQNVVLGWGEYLNRKTSWKSISADTSNLPGCSTAAVSAERSGWFWHSDTLYVKRRNGLSPAGLKLHVGYRDKLIEVLRRNWHISQLTFRFAGSLTDQSGTNSDNWTNRAAPAENGYGILATGCSSTHSVSGLTIDSCKFIGLNNKAIATSNVCAHSDSVTVVHCYFDGLSVGSWDYSAGKCRIDEESTQPGLGCGYSSFDWNTMTGTFNGWGGGAGEADSTGEYHSEICYNFFKNMPDDGVEIDVSDNINLLIMGNTCLDTGSGISIAPCYRGPQFVFYNSFLNARYRGIKGSLANTAITKVYQNTFASNSLSGSPAYDDSPGGGAGVNYEFVNNILFAKKGTALIYGPSSGGSTSLNTFNYDLLDTTGAVTRLVNWNGSTYSFPSMQTSFGWEANGARAAIGFADSAGGRWQLNEYTSNAARMGRRITGVNTDLYGRIVGGTMIPPTYPVGSQPCFGLPCGSRP